MPLCPYCRTPIEESEVPVCPECETPHHQECWMENGGCSVTGCSMGPEDEPKMAISQTAPLPTLASAPRRSVESADPRLANRFATEGNYGRRSRTAFMVLGLLFGAFGFHNFYAGHKLRGVVQLLFCCLTLFYGAFLTWPCAVVEILMVSRDGQSRLMD